MATVKDLLISVNPYKRTYYNYAAVFNIKLSDYYLGPPYFFTDSQVIQNELWNYFRKNKDFLYKFYKDWHRKRSIRQIADETGLDVKKILELFNTGKIFSNYLSNHGNWTEAIQFSYISNYQIIELLTGKQVIERPKSIKPTVVKGELSSSNNKREVVPSNTIAIIGYEDIKAYIIEELGPIINPEDIKDWGLNNPGGILLYGPPGCGKTLWANWIASFLGYEFIEIPRSVFGSSYVDGAMNNLKKILDDLKSKTKVVVFFDEFDSVAAARGGESSDASSSENTKVVNTLLQEIPKLISKQIVLVAATNFIDSLDPAVIRPGRFDLKLPIFPPLPNERCKLLFDSLISDTSFKRLMESSPLIEILKYNNANNSEYWKQFSKDLMLFSNSQVIDAAKIIKRKVRQLYKAQNFSTKTTLTDEFFSSSIKEAQAKLTSKDIQTLSKFLYECQSLQLDIFDERIRSLEFELFPHFRQKKRNPIGFNMKK